ncbi:peptidoglycan-binding protein [Cellulomonas sp. URHB0016]
MQQTAGNRVAVQAVQRSGVDERAAHVARVPTATAPPTASLLRRGSTGDDVRHAQERLNAHGATPPLATDAIFGPLTQAATVHYQRTHALSPDAVIGPRTAASLDGPTDVGGSSGQAAPRPTAPPAGGVLRYDTSAYTIAPPPAGTTMASLRAVVAARQGATPPELGPTVTVTGVATGSQAELYLWNVLVQLGQRTRWGTEADLETHIGPAPTSPPGRAPVGRVTVRIDAQGNAVASLVATGPVPAAPAFTDRASAETALLALGFASVTEVPPAVWGLEELAKVHAALSAMPAGDRSALAGVELRREATLTDATGAALAGKFSHSATLVTGATTATRSETLSIADLAFAGDGLSFVGDAARSGPASAHTIVHEAGHAVETKALRDAQFETMQAQGAMNATITRLNAAVAVFNPAMRASFAAARRWTPAQRQQGARLLAAVNATSTAIQALATNDAPDRNAARDRAATQAAARRDTARAALARAAPTHPALTDFAATLTAQDAWLVAARARAQANATVHDRRADETAVSGAAGGSRRLADFVTVVNANRVPPLTEYARRNWPGHPEEFFAEAYALWQNDRQYLQTNAPSLVTWFDGGGHRR